MFVYEIDNIKICLLFQVNIKCTLSFISSNAILLFVFKNIIMYHMTFANQFI